MSRTDQHVRIRQIAAWLPALCIMIIIFSFSAREASDSSHTSSHLLDMLARISEHLFGVAIRHGTTLYDTLHVIIRKLGHLSEYMALGFFLTLPLHMHGLRRFRLLLAGEAVSILYACSDEFHQLFVPGRDGNITDVAIDSLGALIGTGAALLLLYLIQRKTRPEISQSRL